MARVSPVKRRQDLVSFEYDRFEYDGYEHGGNHALFSKEPVKQSLLASSAMLRDALMGKAFDDAQNKTKPTEQPKGSAPSHSVQALEIGQIGGTDRRTADKLKKGRMDIDARLDLHGSTLAQAHSRLYGFITSVQASGARCVLVVTGKGRSTLGDIGKLKAAVPRWLNEPTFRPYVLSLSYAQQKDGGDGALYILLRKKGNSR